MEFIYYYLVEYLWSLYIIIWLSIYGILWCYYLVDYLVLNRNMVEKYVFNTYNPLDYIVQNNLSVCVTEQ